MYAKISSSSTSRGIVLFIFLLLTGCGSIISKEAREKFYGSPEPFSVTVYPVHMVLGDSAVAHDTALAERLAGWLQEHNLACPVVADQPVEVPIQWGHNQARMLRRSAETFSRQVAASGIETDYALLVEILSNPTETWVGGVHFYLSDRNGLLASGGLSNSHHREFKQVNPQDREGGYEVLVRVLSRVWGRRAPTAD